MKKLIFILFILFISTNVKAQLSWPFPQILTVNPVGACANGIFAVNITANTLFYCASSLWQASGGGTGIGAIMAFSSGVQTVPAASTQLFGNGVNSGFDDANSQVIPVAGTAQSLTCTPQGAPVGIQTFIYHILKSVAGAAFVDNGMTCTITGAALTCSSIQTNIVAIGDRLEAQVVTSATAAVMHHNCSIIVK